MRNRSTSALIGFLVLLFVLLRLAVIIGDHCHHLINHEHLFMACLSKDMCSGLVMPISEYIYLSRQQGQLFMCAFASPFYALMGDSHATLLFAAFMWSLMTLLVWIFCLSRIYGRAKVTLLFCLLYALPPPGLLRASLESSGHYPQQEVLLAISLLTLFIGLREKRGEGVGGVVPFCVLGFLCGFGLYWHPYFVIMLALVLLYMLILRPRFFAGREILLFGVFFLMGFLPRIYYHLYCTYLGTPEPMVGERYNLIASDGLSLSFLTGSLKRCLDMVRIGVPVSLNAWGDYVDGVQSRFLPRINLYISLLLGAYLLVKNRRSFQGFFRREAALTNTDIYRNTFPLILPVVYLLILGFTGMSRWQPFERLRIMTFFSFFTLINALALSHMLGGRRVSRVCGWLILVVLMAASIAGDWKLLASEKTGLGRYKRGTYYPVLALKLKYKIFDLGLNVEDSLNAVLQKRDPFDRRVLTITLGDMPWSILVCPHFPGNLEDNIEIARTITSPFRSYFWRGLGRIWIYSGRPLGELVEFSKEHLSDDEMSSVIRGAGAMSAFTSEPFIDDYRVRIEMPRPHAQIRSASDMKYFRGWESVDVARDVADKKIVIDSLLEDIPEEFRGDFVFGFLDYLSWKHDQYPAKFLDAVKAAGLAKVPRYEPAPYFFPPMLECYL